MVFHRDKKSKERESWKGNPKPFEESLFSLTQEPLSSHKFVKSCLLLKKNKRVCKKTIFPFAQILWVCWLAVHPIEIGEKRRAKVFNFFTKPLLLLWLYFSMLTDFKICIYSWTAPQTIRSYPMLRTKYGCGISTSWRGRGLSRPTLTNRWFIFDIIFGQHKTTSYRKCCFPNILRVSRILYCHLYLCSCLLSFEYW